MELCGSIREAYFISTLGQPEQPLFLSMVPFWMAWAKLFYPELVAAFWVCAHTITMVWLMPGDLLTGVTWSGFLSSWHDNVWCFCFPSLLAYTEQYLEYDPFLVPPDPSNPWISDDTTFWELEARYIILFLLRK